MTRTLFVKAGGVRQRSTVARGDARALLALPPGRGVRPRRIERFAARFAAGSGGRN
jgi:hypothetical protein